MTTRLPLLLVAGLALGLAADSYAQTGCEAIQFRAWTAQGETWFASGEPVIVQPNVETHLYIHHEAGGPSTPYRTSAQIGHASDFGYRVRSGNVRFRRQKPEDAQAGRLILDAQGAAEAVLGYRVTGVNRTGVFDRLPAHCRVGVVSIQVRADDGTDNGGPASDPRAANLAARQLQRRIHLALEPWEPNPAPNDDEIGAIRGQGQGAVVEIAARVLSSQGFRDQSWRWAIDAQPDITWRSETRTPPVGMVANHLLNEIYTRLYGDQQVDVQTHRSNLQDLMACLDSRGDRGACTSLARSLVANELYAEHNSEPLAALAGGGQH